LKLDSGVIRFVAVGDTGALVANSTITSRPLGSRR